MSKQDFSVNGALVGGMAGWVAEVAIQEVTGHHVTTGILEILGAAVGHVAPGPPLDPVPHRHPGPGPGWPGPRLPGGEAPHRRTDPGPAGIAGDSWATWWTWAFSALYQQA